MKIIVITSPKPVKDECCICNSLFAHGLELLHLRKPGGSYEEYETFIRQIDPHYRKRIVIHDHYELAQKYPLRGIHLKSGEGEKASQYADLNISISCHSIEEIQSLSFRPSYCFLSPIFDSISKPGYKSVFPQIPDLTAIDIPVIALGGITPERLSICRNASFQGVAVLGYLWQQPIDVLNRFIRLCTPFTMSIAGFDPSSGAGVSADLKTFEATGSYGLGVCSALTFQDEVQYKGSSWIPLEEIQKQAELLLAKYHPEYIKIGLIENSKVLAHLVDWLKNRAPKSKIIWDPILKATAGYVFHDGKAMATEKILKQLYLITPNQEEVEQLFGKEATPETLHPVCQQHQLNILWKGGHRTGEKVTDYLITPEKIYHFSIYRTPYSKHGTGCMLSSALLSFLAQGVELSEACAKAQLYVSNAINSNDSRLSYHYLQYANSTTLPPLTKLHLQYITDPKDGTSLASQIEAVCCGGVQWVQLRMKNNTKEEILQESKIAKEICHRYHSLFIVNDHVEIAKQVDADGVHLGKTDMDPREARQILGKHKIIGATCNSWEDILLRQQQQVDYIGLGPFAFTTTKKNLSPILRVEGYQTLLQKMREQHIHIPVFAIGGITETDIPSLMKTGIQGIALSGVIKNSEDISLKSREILHIINQSVIHTLKILTP